MKKREFLAMSGALPLMLAGCGSGTGSAPVRLVNASVGYPLLGFMDEANQATTADVAYGAASPFESVQAGAVTLTLNVAGQPATASQVRTISKDQRYSLVAYGFTTGLSQVLITESTIAPDSNTANVNVLNTSVDIGPVDVYLSAKQSLAVSTKIAAGINGVSQSAFTSTAPGSYFVTVVGAQSVENNVSDVRFQSNTAILSVVNQQIETIILTPGLSGVLANVILLTQGTAGQATATTSYQNTTARVRAVTALSTSTASQITGLNSAGSMVSVMPSHVGSEYSEYKVVNTGTVGTGTGAAYAGSNPTLTVIVNGSALDIVMDSTDATTGVTSEVAGALAAGGDYTLMIYLNGGTPKAKLIIDDNTAPTSATGMKFRLINLAVDNPALFLTMKVNSVAVASLVPFGSASAYTAITTVPQSTPSTIQVLSGTTPVFSFTQTLALSTTSNTLANIFTAIVVDSADATGYFFTSSALSGS
jgi:Domain of unknown function (DUF4397)